jgi:hypothetical protein
VTQFLDGPAKGQHLMLKRKVRFLRVVEAIGGVGGKWDALDMPEDVPATSEKLYAYEAAGNGGMCHINRGGGQCGFYSVQDYKFVPEQPDDATMRDRSKWVAWCEAKAANERSAA